MLNSSAQKAQGDRCLCSHQNVLLSPANHGPPTELHLAHYLNADNLSTAMQLHVCKSTLKTAYPLACFTSDSTNKERILSITASQLKRKKKNSETLYQDNISSSMIWKVSTEWET